MGVTIKDIESLKLKNPPDRLETLAEAARRITGARPSDPLERARALAAEFAGNHDRHLRALERVRAVRRCACGCRCCGEG